MILLDKPFISELLKKTIREHAFPVVKTDVVATFGFSAESFLLQEEQAILQAKSTPDLQIYTTSENALGWIVKNLPFTSLPEKIALFKDKARFRNLIKPLYPDFFFQEVSLTELEDLTLENLPHPFIIKPNVGFFSMGVYKITDADSWQQTKKAIYAEIAQTKDLYPVEVLNPSTFIIEECIDGEEFAIDAYFNSAGEPVILSILQHVFASDEDVSDRVYLTSQEIITKNLAPFTSFLQEISTLAKVKNFPVHVEIRRDHRGRLIPIEINPMRFGGWCTTADLTTFAYGFNPYVYFFSQKKPDWTKILHNKADKLYSLIVLDNSTGVESRQIAAFDYERLLTGFKKPLELRKIAYDEYPVFGFLFVETTPDGSELEQILRSDLREFITLK